MYYIHLYYNHLKFFLVQYKYILFHYFHHR
nr:MAG TPA: hypothetical protein [Crassvirales sp.]